MKSIKALIIDDEAPARDIIRHYLKRHPDIVVAGECADGFAALKAIRELSPDLLFLDVQMPRLNGFEMLELMDGKPAIIFITAYDQYAIRAFEHSAIDYLLKPFSAERFDSAIGKVRSKLEDSTEHEGGAAEIMREAPAAGQSLSRIVVRKGNAIIIIPVENIRFLEAQNDYVMIHHTEGRALKQQRMKYYEENLPARHFVRIHRSYIVRVDSISKLEPYGKESYIAVLGSGERLPVSKSGYRSLRNELSPG